MAGESSGSIGPSSAIYDSQLVPIAMASAIMPPAAPYVTPSNGAAVGTLPGLSAGGAALNGGGSLSDVGSTATAEQAGAAPSGGKILGLPAVVFYVLGAVAVAYIFIWQVHFKG